MNERTPIPIILSKLHKLNNATIRCNIRELLCDDSENSQLNNMIIMRSDYAPDTFSVYDRLYNNIPYLSNNELIGEMWIESVVEEQLETLQRQNLIYFDSVGPIKDFCFHQVMNLLEYDKEEMMVSEMLTNQEIPDVINKVLSYVIFGNPIHELRTHQEFNKLAQTIIPNIIHRKLKSKEYSPKDLLSISIYSGLVGLDVKGSTAAASNISSFVIPLNPILNCDLTTIENFIWEKLNKLSKKLNGIFHWSDFNQDVLTQPCKLVWFTDDYIESIFDLWLIQELLKRNSELTISIIPRRRIYGNDMSYNQMMNILRQSIFSTLSKQIMQGKARISTNGPSMATVNLKKLSREVVENIIDSDFVFIKGCRAHEMIQGGLNKPSYTAYVVAREFSESETGLDAREAPTIFIKSEPGEYAYWGFRGRSTQRKIFDDGKAIPICYSTTEEHERRKRMADPREITWELNTFLTLQNNIIRDGYKIPYFLEIQNMVEKLIDVTMTTYDFIADDFKKATIEQPNEVEIKYINKLLKYARKRVEDGKLGNSDGKINLLDVGTGPGRDLRYLDQILEVYAIGIDNCDTMIEILDAFAKVGEISSNTYLLMDMRNLDQFEDSTFDIVRHNASLLHLPLISLGMGCDEAIAESYRVLKPNGLLYICVREGKGIEFVSTIEGVGGRLFQYFSIETIENLLLRNGFNILDIEERLEQRPTGDLRWLVVYAEKNNIWKQCQ